MKVFETCGFGVWSALIDRGRRRNVSGEFLSLEHDHVLVERLQHGVMETRGAVEKAELAHIKQHKFEERPTGYAIEQLLLMKTALVDIFFEEGLTRTELLVRRMILHNLQRFKGAVGIVPVQPVRHALAERIVI
jgi:hypothetical protein